MPRLRGNDDLVTRLTLKRKISVTITGNLSPHLIANLADIYYKRPPNLRRAVWRARLIVEI